MRLYACKATRNSLNSLNEACLMAGEMYGKPATQEQVNELAGKIGSVIVEVIESLDSDESRPAEVRHNQETQLRREQIITPCEMNPAIPPNILAALRLIEIFVGNSHRKVECGIRRAEVLRDLSEAEVSAYETALKAVELYSSLVAAFEKAGEAGD